MSVTAFPLERRISYCDLLRTEAIARRQRLYFPPNGRASDETEVMSPHALRKLPPPTEWPITNPVVIHSYPQDTIEPEVNYIPSAYAGIIPTDIEDEPSLIDGVTSWPVTIRDIARAACRVFDTSMLDLCSARRSSSIVRPRQIVMYLAREMTKRSLPEIGRLLGGRDHTTVLHAWRKLSALINEDKDLFEQINAVRSAALNGRKPAEQPTTG